MKILLKLTVLLLFVATIHAQEVKNKTELLNELSTERYFPYQDIIINNEIISKGVGPDCDSRYQAIKKILTKYQRPIKVLDIGASNGYFSFKIANDFNALCVMADLSDRLLKICQYNDQIPNVIYLKKELNLEDLTTLNNNEHFDVVLALNVVHHMEPWKKIIDILFKLADTVIIETPPANDDRVKETPSIPQIEEYLLHKKNYSIIAQTPRAAANNFDAINTLHEVKDALTSKKYTPDAYAKMFCFEQPILIFNIPSFQLASFNVLNGVYPATINNEKHAMTIK